MRLLLSIFAVMLIAQSANAQGLWRNYWTTNKNPFAIADRVSGTLTNPIANAASNYFGTVQSTNILDPSNVKYWGAVGDGVTDDTAAISNAVYSSTTGSGSLFFPPGTYITTQPIRPPNDGTNQSPLAIYGPAPGNATINSAAIKFQITSDSNTVACVDLRASGMVEIKNIGLLNYSNTVPLLFLGGARAFINGVYFSSYGQYADAIIAGGTNTSYSISTNMAFGGYGTVISGNTFLYCSRALLGQSGANSITFQDNWYGSGTNAAVEFIGITPGLRANANRIIGNLFQLDGGNNYAIKLDKADWNVITANGFFDEGPQMIAAIRYETDSFYNHNSANFTTATYVSDASGAASLNVSQEKSGFFSPVASVFGSGGSGAPVTVPQLSSQSYYGAGLNFRTTSTANADLRNWTLRSDHSAYGDFAIMQGNAIGYDPNTNGTVRMMFGQGGNVGIGTNSPAAKLDVVGDVLASGIIASGGGLSVTGLVSKIEAGSANTLVVTNGFVGVGVATPKTPLAVSGSYTATGANVPTTFSSIFNGGVAIADGDSTFTFALAGTAVDLASYNYGTTATIPLRFQGNGGNVAIGYIIPAAKLDVAGDIRASTTITATNGFFLPTQTAPPVVAGGGTLWNSNSVLYWVTATKTNMVSDGR